MITIQDLYTGMLHVSILKLKGTHFRYSLWYLYFYGSVSLTIIPVPCYCRSTKWIQTYTTECMPVTYRKPQPISHCPSMNNLKSKSSDSHCLFVCLFVTVMPVNVNTNFTMPEELKASYKMSAVPFYTTWPCVLNW